MHEFVAKLRPEYEGYNQKKNELLARYSEAFWELDLDELIEHFSSFGYRTFLKHVHPGFRKDKNQIIRTTRTASLQESILEDLVKARELHRSKVKIESEGSVATNLLGSYHRSFDTQFDQIDQALNVAADTVKLARHDPLPPELVSCMRVDQTPAAELSAIGTRMLDGIKKWELAAEELGTLISEAKLPNGQSIRQGDIGSLEQWAVNVRRPLETVS